VQKLESRYTGKEVPAPAGWGGYRLRPDTIEFWQGRVNRLHDRLLYSRQPDGRWKMERLAP
jgi:pyridoxamine 5'-phosphate oxidase